MRRDRQGKPLPPDSHLGEPKRQFSETFHAIEAFRERYPSLFGSRYDDGELVRDEAINPPGTP